MTSIEPIEFGTDGLRGRAGQAPIDPETLRRVGSALGVLLQQSGGERHRVMVGNDGRESAPWILDCLVQGLMAAEISVAHLGLCTTPALASLVRIEPYAAGIMISASHNPSHDNGIKIFAADGSKLRDDDETALALLAQDLRPNKPGQPRIRSVEELLLRYEQLLGERFPQLDLTGKKICVDAANGGGSVIAPRVLRAFGAEVIEVGCEPDGFNINEGLGALHPEVLAAAVTQHGACFGICLDGDGDRGIFVDEQGTVRDGDDVMSLFGRRLAAAGELPGGEVVATVMSNLGLHRSLQDAGVKVRVTPVGDRNVNLAMQACGAAIGGEQSGHILFRDHHLIGDGLYTGLRILALLGDQPASAVFAGFRRYPQQLVNVMVREKPDLLTIPAIAAKAAAIEQQLGSEGRLLLRYSGTEPKCRVMIEAADAATCERLCSELADVIRQELGA